MQTVAVVFDGAPTKLKKHHRQGLKPQCPLWSTSVLSLALSYTHAQTLPGGVRVRTVDVRHEEPTARGMFR